MKPCIIVDDITNMMFCWKRPFIQKWNTVSRMTEFPFPSVPLWNCALSTFTWTYPYFIFDSFQVNISHVHLSFKVCFSSNVYIWFQLHLNEQNLLLIILVLVNNNKTGNTQVMPLFTEECIHIYGIYRMFLSLKEDVWSSFSFITCRHSICWQCTSCVP